MSSSPPSLRALQNPKSKTKMPTGRILIVEDRDSLRRMLERALGQEGYEVDGGGRRPTPASGCSRSAPSTSC